MNGHFSIDRRFWQSRRVFLTGHTGFKGGWLSLWLASMGASVTGYSLVANTSPALFEVLHLERQIEASVIGDINNLDELCSAMRKANPEIVIHMAAQPLVRFSYTNPIETFKTNVLGTAHVLEAVRQTEGVRAVVIVTTDKCYENDESGTKFTELARLGGHDPYSSSKACAELVASAFRRSYFSDKTNGNSASVATARAGNVIGGGDWSTDRLVPDAIRAFERGLSVGIRNPLAVRPWQHVIEPLAGYLLLAEKLFNYGDKFAESWNFGPKDADTRSVGDIVKILAASWSNPASWHLESQVVAHEAQILKLDIKKAMTFLDWRPKWPIETALSKVIYWHESLNSRANMMEVSLKQIEEYQSTNYLAD